MNRALFFWSRRRGRRGGDAIEAVFASLAYQRGPHDVLCHHVFRYAHAVGDFLVRQALETIEHEGLVATWGKCFDGSNQRACVLRVGVDRIGLKVRRRAGLIGLDQVVDVFMFAQLQPPAAVDHQMARRLVQQRARLGDGLTRLLDGQDSCVALLNEIGGRVTVFDHAGAEIQQFAVVTLKHRGTTARENRNGSHYGCEHAGCRDRCRNATWQLIFQARLASDFFAPEPLLSTHTFVSIFIPV